MIKLKEVGKTYQTGKVLVPALRSVDLEIGNGELVVISGVSGSGKSTLLNLLGAMDKPSTGSIQIDGEDLSQCSPRQLCDFRARKIGFIFQNFNLIPVLNVYENIVVPLKMKGQSYEHKQILGLIESVGLAGHVKHRPDELSGGQRQRVAIARAIAGSPPYILADEPTANLDSENTRNIVELLEALNRERGVTIICASHDPIIQQKDIRKIVLKDGKIE